MTSFHLQAPFQPTGDQPQAIAQLVDGVKADHRLQTLLGATGTGKSVGHNDPVFVVEKQGSQNIPRILPIGELIDRLIEEYPDLVQMQGDTLVLEADSSSVQYYAQSFNPETCTVALYKIRSFIRHGAPATMYRLQTACGRSATLTGDHNLWVLRDGQMQLIKTSEAKSTDYVPLPEKLALHNQGMIWTPETGRRGDGETGRRGDGEMGRQGFSKKLQNPTSNGDWGIGIRDLSLTAHPTTYSPIRVHNPLLPVCFPCFWIQLSEASLGKLLRAYFDRHSTIENSAITATTSSHKLASDLVYALLRFGIWARITLQYSCSYQVTLSGQADLKRFEQFIGFSLPHKQQALIAQIQLSEDSNFDIVPIKGKQLGWLRNQLGLSAKLLGERSGISPSAIQFFETGKPSPKRSTLVKLLATLHREARKTKNLNPHWWLVWKSIEKLSQLRWTPIATVEEIEYQHPYVYDFCVPGAETFLAGIGGFFVHNTFTIASAIAQIQKPTLVLAHNKTLAAQLCNELRQFFPDNAVEYFISYYDYYQPEAYIPVTDTYIEKSASINDEIDMLRHSATRSLFERRDVIVVASISCIYGLGMPSEYLKAAITLELGMEINQRQLLRDLVSVQYSRNDLDIGRGRFRLKGDVLEIVPAYEDRIIRVEFFGDEIEALRYIDPVTGKIIQNLDTANIYPARHFVTPDERLERACQGIKEELEERLEELEKTGKLLEAQRLEQRTRYDLEMLQEVGYCNGVENYSRYLAERNAGEPPECLIDYFPKDWLLVVDESHVTVPQLRGMYKGDRARKKVLIEHGFRLPSAADNRPLKAEEFWTKVNQCIFVSATPGDWEIEQSEDKVIEQVIRPTGVVDPEIFVRPTKGQVDDLLGEIKERVKRQERVLITTLTKRMAEDLTEYFQERGIRVQYLHSEIQSIERIEILQALREGNFDVLIGVNLLREGLDLPEVSLVAILDADKEGFLRAERSLIQTIGRAARHVGGQAILYADNLTDSMVKAIEETDRRRGIQMAYNRMHGITPQSIVKKSSNAILSFLDISRRLNTQQLEEVYEQADDLPLEKIPELIGQLEEKMKEAAKNLEFEEAAKYRDRIKHLRDKLLGH